ncbi:MAG: hypothetical protein RLZZ618_247 [Pseudomonadota bacterium]|jgi:hypothetical protein
MNLMPEWWTSLGRRRETPPVDTDFADMGTAFGLDASIEADLARGPSEGVHPATGLPVVWPQNPAR